MENPHYNEEEEDQLIESSIDVSDIDSDGQDFIMQCMYYGFDR